MEAKLGIESSQPRIFRDIGGPKTVTVTNDAKAVVEFLRERGLLASDNCVVNYIDSENQLSGLLVKDGCFAGFCASSRDNTPGGEPFTSIQEATCAH